MGAAAAALLADAGCRVAVWDTAASSSAELHVSCDVSDSDAVERAMATTVGALGVPTLVTHAAAIGDSAAIADAPVALWDRVMAVNARGAFLVVKVAAAAMADAGETGSVVVLSSISGRIADRGMAPYCASKAAVDMLVKVAAAEFGPLGIRVNAVAPGVTDTPMLAGAARIPGWTDAVGARTPLGGVGSAGAVAAAVLALHGLDWVTGVSIAADGGLSLHSPIDTYGAVADLRAGRSL